jgi:hypothetical protein
VSFLALGAEPEELEPMRHLAESMLSGDAVFEIGRDAVVDLDDLGTAAADEMMVMMPAGLVLGDFESGAAIAEIDALHQAELFEASEGAVDRGEVAAFGGKSLDDLLGRPWPLSMAKNIEDVLA